MFTILVALFTLLFHKFATIVCAFDPLPNGLSSTTSGWTDCRYPYHRKVTNLCGITDIWVAGYFKSCYDSTKQCTTDNNCWDERCDPSSDSITQEEIDAKNEIETKYGHLEDWDVSGVTRMDFMFYYKKNFSFSFLLLFSVLLCRIIQCRYFKMGCLPGHNHAFE